MTGTTGHYTSVAKALHWLIAIMILGQIAGGLYMHNLPASETKYSLYQLHKSFGLTILALALFRLYWRLAHKAPALPEGMAAWERVFARITHVAFYVLIIAIPLAGWLMVSASTTGIGTKLFFLVPVPHFPLPQSEGLEDALAETHEYLAFSTLALLVLHVGGALKHHFLAKDDVLLRMAPTSLHRQLNAWRGGRGDASRDART